MHDIILTISADHRQPNGAPQVIQNIPRGENTIKLPCRIHIEYIEQGVSSDLGHMTILTQRTAAPQMTRRRQK